MCIDIIPSPKLSAKVVLPASKSISNRALIIHALTRDAMSASTHLVGTLKNLSDCDDTRVMTNALANMPEVIDIKAAGTAMRFLSAYLSVVLGTHTITGTERMRHRPIGILVDALRQLGAGIDYVGEKGFPPLRITGGRLAGGRIRLPGNVSSQYVSALLMVGPRLDEGLTLELEGDVVSRPYINMTASIMRHFGACVEWISDHELHVDNGGYRLSGYHIESDWSASSYWYEMLALSKDPSSCVVLPGLLEDSLQGDSVVRELFEPLGVQTTFLQDEDGIGGACLTKKSTRCQRMERDLVNCPDLAQAMVATCALMGVPFRFTGLQSLRIKETDRLSALRVELSKLGYDVREEGGSVLCWDGTRVVAQECPSIDTYDDHRMAMCMAPASMVKGSIRINNPEVVSKSYPGFWNDLRACGFKVKES